MPVEVGAVAVGLPLVFDQEALLQVDQAPWLGRYRSHYRSRYWSRDRSWFAAALPAHLGHLQGHQLQFPALQNLGREGPAAGAGVDHIPGGEVLPAV